MKHPLIRKFFWIIIFAALLYAAFVIWSDARKNIEVFRGFPWSTMPLIIGAVMVNFLVRELKWDYYRRVGGINVPRGGSFLLFFSGFSMCITPGRIGELIKPVMYKEYFDQKMRRTIPLVFCERVSDLLGMILLGVITAGAYSAGVKRGVSVGQFNTILLNGFLALSIVFMVGMVWLARRKHTVYAVLLWAARRKVLNNAARKLRKLYFATYPLLTVRNLTVTTLMAAFSWAFECVALWYILHGVGAVSISLMQSAFMFCMATILGGFFFFLPGGLGAFETGMLGMLRLLGVEEFKAVPAIVIIRFSTLFFGVALGFLFILITSTHYHMRMKWEEVARVGDREVPEQE
jgi:glycosyltransferase 2 family protein